MKKAGLRFVLPVTMVMLKTSRVHKRAGNQISSILPRPHGRGWFRGIVCLAISLAALTGCSQERPAPRTAIAATAAPASGMAHGDHNPKFKGVVMMNGTLHFEVVANRDGYYNLYFSDEARHELPASVVSGLKLEVTRPGYRPEPVEMKISDTGENWEGKGGSVSEADVSIHILYTYQGTPKATDLPFAAAANELNTSAKNP
jgi:hypothetical protein